MIKDVNIGYDIPNLIKISNIVIRELGVESEVYIMPMRTALDDNAFVSNGGGKYLIFVSPRILERDAPSNHNIRVLIHEITHIKLMEDGDLVMSGDHSRVEWRGRLYTNKDDYNSRPFEVEAKRNEKKYFKRVKEEFFKA